MLKKKKKPRLGNNQGHCAVLKTNPVIYISVRALTTIGAGEEGLQTRAANKGEAHENHLTSRPYWRDTLLTTPSSCTRLGLNYFSHVLHKKHILMLGDLMFIQNSDLTSVKF